MIYHLLKKQRWNSKAGLTKIIPESMDHHTHQQKLENEYLKAIELYNNKKITSFNTISHKKKQLIRPENFYAIKVSLLSSHIF